jgi:hypothetical protein
VTRFVRCTCAAAALCVGGARPAFAQSARLASRLEISAGVSAIGSLDLGSTTAGETTPTQTTRPLFTTAATFGAAPSVEGRVGWRFSRALTAEAEASYGRPELRVTAANDNESDRAGDNAAAVTAAERVQQFTVGGAIVYHLAMGSPRVAPFVSGGGGYLRDLHESGTLAQEGRYYQVGGGLTVLIASRGSALLKAMGIRVDARALMRANGVAFDDALHVAPAVGASFFVRF